MKVGSSVGMITKRNIDGVEQWALIEDKVKQISELKSGKRIYTKSKFRPLDFDDVCNNTEIMENKDFVIVREVFELTPKVRKRANEWIVWANDNPDRVKSILD